MQATARRLSVVSATSTPHRRLVRTVRPTNGVPRSFIEVINSMSISASALQPGRKWLLAFGLSFLFFVFLSVTDHYDGVMTLIGAPIVSIVLTSVCMVGVTLVGLVLRVAIIRRWWCLSFRPALLTMIVTTLLLSCSTSIGLSERYVDSIDGSVRFRPHWAIGIPCYILLLASITFWPAPASQASTDHIKP